MPWDLEPSRWEEESIKLMLLTFEALPLHTLLVE